MLANVSGDHIARGVLTTLETWLPHFLADQERIEGISVHTLKAPESYVLAADLDGLRAQDGYPRCVVLVPGLAATPNEGPEGYYRAQFGVAAGIFTRGRDRAEVRSQLSIYVAAIRRCILVKGVDGLDCDITWSDEAYDTVPGKQADTLGGGEVAFLVFADNVLELTDPWPHGVVDDPYEPEEGVEIVDTPVDVFGYE